MKDFGFIDIVTFATSGYAQRYAVGRDDDAVLGGAVRAEDNGEGLLFIFKYYSCCIKTISFRE